MKGNDIRIRGVPEGKRERERESKGLRTCLRKMTENFPNLVKEKDTQVQEAQRAPDKMDSLKCFPLSPSTVLSSAL